MGKHVSHDVDYCVCTAFTFFPVLNGNAIVYHILYIASIFGHNQFLFFCIIFHYKFCLSGKVTDYN